jgi:hypothetical protein
MIKRKYEVRIFGSVKDENIQGLRVWMPSTRVFTGYGGRMFWFVWKGDDYWVFWERGKHQNGRHPLTILL